MLLKLIITPTIYSVNIERYNLFNTKVKHINGRIDEFV